MEENTKGLEKLDLNKLEAKDGVITIIHQENNSPHLEKLHEEEYVSLNGTITAPANFFEKRKTEIAALKAHIKYSYRNRVIILVTDEDFSELGSEIKGELIKNPALDEFALNTNKMFAVGELTKHLRVSKFFFESEEQHKKVILSLQNFTATVNAEIKKINDNKGNIEDVYKTTTKSNAELSFKAKMPVFIGQPDKVFDVEIACEATSTGVRFWLESTDLIVLLQKDTKALIDTELARFDEKLVFIEQ